MTYQTEVNKEIQVIYNSDNVQWVGFTPYIEAICSVGGKPFWGSATIEYEPQEYILEFCSVESFICTFKDKELTIEGFTRSLAQEVGSRGITVNAVAPGFIETDMTAALEENQVELMASRIPLGTLGQAEDVANAVAFLASDRAAYITGETLHVNGGLYMA